MKKQEVVYPCKGCLKYSICISQQQIKCRDLVTWLLGTVEKGVNVYKFEKCFWNKDVSIIDSIKDVIYFKDERDHYSAMII